jgi:hypothetical protein
MFARPGRRETLIAVLVLVVALPFAARYHLSHAATVIYVHAAAGGASDGTSWEAAYADLQAALAAASSGDEVWVAAGTYLPTTTTSRTASFVLESGVAVYGGFAGFETARTQRDPKAYETVLSGDIGLAGTTTDNAYHVVQGGSAGPTAILDGFTITGGRADGAGADEDIGGGIIVGSGSPAFANLVVIANFASSEGAGIAIDTGSPSFSATSITGNVAATSNTARGGGASNRDGSPSFTDVGFRGNRVTSSAASGGLARGGAFFGDDGAPTFKRVSFIGNSAQFTGASGTATVGGGAYANSGDTPTFTDVVFVGNTVSGTGLTPLSGGAIEASGATFTLDRATFVANRAGRGGAIRFSSNGTLLVSNATFTGNRSGAAGGGILSSADVTLKNVTFRGNFAPSATAWSIEGGSASAAGVIAWSDTIARSAGTATMSDSIVQAGCPAGVSCTNVGTADPLLQSLTKAGSTLALPIGAGSPAIDSGPTAGCPSSDQAGQPRPVDGNLDGAARCDIGATEFRPPAPSVRFALASSSGPEDTATRKVDVILSAKYFAPVTVKYAVTGGGATSGRDYTLAAGTLTFPALSTLQQISIAVKDDFAVEPGESIVLTLSSPANASLGSPSTHTHTIANDEPKAVCGGSPATFVGTAAADTIRGTAGTDVIAGLGGNDTILGLGGSDIICAGENNDLVRGGRGNDRLFGEGGNDQVRGESGDDEANGGDGNDSVQGHGGNDELHGNGGTDVVSGGTGADVLSGDAGPGDRCAGGPGADSTPAGDGCERKSGVP